jgi:ParB/RepB/Spo0J family partition protein
MALNLLAFQNADVLRALSAGGHESNKALAKSLGRDDSNLGRSLRSLLGAGLITEASHRAELTPAGADQLAALDRADGINPDGAPAPAMPSGFALIPHQLIVPDGLNPRKHFDETELAELAESIAQDGLLENLVVRPINDGDTAHRLVAGERRWRALRLLIAAGRWDQPIPCKIVEIDDAAHRRIALVENLQRKDLRPIDEAQALKDLMEVTGQGTAEIAKEIGFTQRFVQQRLQLLGLPDTVQDQVNAGEVTIEKARAMAAVLPDLPADKAKALTTGKITPEDAKRWLENQPTLWDNLPPRQWLILLEIADAALRATERASGYIPVGAAIAEDEDFQALKAIHSWMINGPVKDWDHGYEVGQGVSLDNYGPAIPQLKLKFPDALDNPAARDLALVKARADAGESWPLAMHPGEYTIPWLRGPFEVPAEVQAQIAQAKADRAAAAQREEAARTEDARRKGEAFNAAQSILVQHRKRALPALDGRYADAFESFDIQLPVTVDPDGNVLDAKGRPLVRSGWGHGNAPSAIIGRNTLLALAINAAAGLHTPDHPRPAAPDVLPQAEFLEVVAGCLIEDVDDLTLADARAMAERGLAAYLAAEAIDYGDPAHDWEEVGAMAIAQGIREDGLGQAETAAATDALETEDA